VRLKEIKIHQFLPLSLDEAWDFFSSPYNLDEITPADMCFEILSDVKDKKMYEGMVIQYKIRPILNIPLDWVTEITHVKEKSHFVDEQRFGPYAFWHHEHHFKAMEGGVKIEDILHYSAPLGLLGKIAEVLYVDNKVKQIFEYRYQKLNELFPIKENKQ
jgi:ligand-binding SRPBCC domain-containing protein|tara:strand:+ start:1633 stop:2109 length:477 start_codon:yes stop_codon:yes gene_type:complete